MNEFFLSIVNMSISASWIVVAVLILRLLFKKAPKWVNVLLWLTVAVRLICPFSFESIFSLIPSAEVINPEIMMDKTPEINTGIPVINDVINPIISDSFTPSPEMSANPLQIWIPVIANIWFVGVIVLLIYTAVSYLLLNRKVATAVLLRDNIYQSENVVSPFVLGIIKPKIYLPFNINEKDIGHVIAHENSHIIRKDHLWKPLGFLILAIHWFNPLMWIAYILLCRDIELACDEKVIKGFDAEHKADYSEALLSCSINRRIIAACPLAFGEVGVKNRIKSVLSYKKPTVWIVTIAIVTIIVLAVCFLTNPTTHPDGGMYSFIEEQILEHHHGDYLTSEFYCTDFEVLGSESNNGKTTVYMWVLYREYTKKNGVVESISGAHVPTVITVRKTNSDEKYELVEYWVPRDGSYYSKDIKSKFPWYLHAQALNSQLYIKKQKESCDLKAEQYFSSFSPGTDLPDDETTSLKELKAKYPMYFDLNTTNGLQVYIWQMAEGLYSCILLPGTSSEYTMVELLASVQLVPLPSASMDVMREIVDYYIENGYVAREKVVIKAIQMPHSSYAYTIDEEYMQKLNGLFWS